MDGNQNYESLCMTYPIAIMRAVLILEILSRFVP